MSSGAAEQGLVFLDPQELLGWDQLSKVSADGTAITPRQAGRMMNKVGEAAWEPELGKLHSKISELPPM